MGLILTEAKDKSEVQANKTKRITVLKTNYLSQIPARQKESSGLRTIEGNPVLSGHMN